MIHIAGSASRIDADDPRCRIDANALHHREIDDEAIIATAKTGTVVSAAPDGQQQAFFLRKIHRAYNVGHVDAACDQPGPLIDHSVVKSPHHVIVRICWADEPSAKAFLESRDCLISHNCPPDMRAVDLSSYRKVPAPINTHPW